MAESPTCKKLRQRVKEFEKKAVERTLTEDQLQHRLEMEELVATISTSFIIIKSDNVDNEISHALQLTGRFTGVDCCCINLLSDDETKIVRAYNWCTEGIVRNPEKAGNMPVKSLGWLMKKLRQFETIHIPKVAGLPTKAAREKKMWQSESIRSVLAIPLILDNALAGFFGFNTVHTEKTWPDEDIRLLRLIGEIISRVLARKQTEDALKESEKHYRAVVDDQDEMICRFLPDTTLTFVNKSYCRYFNRNQNDLIGRPFLELILDEEHEAIRNLLKTFTPDNYINTYEHPVNAPKGELRWQQWTDRAIFDDQGQLTEFQSVGRDITERRKADKALKNAYLELKDTQAQLVQSAKLASIGQLAAGVAHELNQPLMVIRLNTQFMMQTFQERNMADDEMLRQLEVIERNTSRMRDTINHLQSFSCQSHRNFQATDINKVIDNSFIMIGEQLRIHGIEVKKNLNRDVPLIWGNENQLEQVFLNLVANARDAVSENQKQEPYKESILEIETGVDKKSSDFVEILIRDNGSGIPAEHLEQIFDPFFTTKDVGEGMGLGLSISYGIIKEHMGDIEATETGQSGTTFRVRLPVSTGGKI
ncbi:MAG: PAS domain S-box protein [Desulfobacteraceae bacterium]|nr:PAS domain S-box protein [Desulfobacteraceae bacterium]